MSSKLQKLEARITFMEGELRKLKVQIAAQRKPWYRAILGVFAGDPVYAEIAKLGREIRKEKRKRTP